MKIEGSSEHTFNRVKSVLLNSVRSDAIFQRLVKNTGSLFGATSVSAGMTMVQGVLVARLLGVELFGTLAVVVTFTTVLNRLFSFRMGELVVKQVTGFLAEGALEKAAAVIKSSLLVEVISSLLAFLTVIALAPFAVRWLIDVPGAEQMIELYALTVLGNAVLETSTGLLHSFNKFTKEAYYTVAGRIVSLIIVVVAFVLEGGILFVMIGYLAGNLTQSLLILFSSLQETKRVLGTGWWRAPLRNLEKQIGDIGRFALGTNISGTLSLVTKDSDILWLGLFTSSADVGYYKLALSLVHYLRLPFAPIDKTIYPELAKQVAARAWSDFASILRKVSFSIAMFLISGGLLLSLLAPKLIGLLYGGEFVPAARAIPILAVGIIFAQIFAWTRPALLALNYPMYPVKINVVISIMKIAGVFIILPRYGYIGNAGLLSAMYLLGVTLSAVKVLKVVRAHQSAEAISPGNIDGEDRLWKQKG